MKYEGGQHHLTSLVLYNMQARRPVGAGADPAADPGEKGWKSDPPPDANLDCKPVRQLFVALSARALRQCLVSITQPETSVEYVLRRETQPFLALENEEKAPACLRSLLPRIPVPREIVFQAEEERDLRCFASRLDVEADRVFGVKLPLNKYLLKLEFPLARVPDREQDLLLLVASWAIMPFFRQDPREIIARPVPEAICARCFEGSRLYKRWEVPGYWPESLHPDEPSQSSFESLGAD